MLSQDLVKRRSNPSPYCDNDPVKFNDSTGEIPSILAGGLLGGLLGNISGFLGGTISQITGVGTEEYRRGVWAYRYRTGVSEAEATMEALCGNYI